MAPRGSAFGAAAVEPRAVPPPAVRRGFGRGKALENHGKIMFYKPTNYN